MTSTQRSARITVTLACFLMATFAWGTVFYGHSVYMDALTRDRGWSTALVSTAILVFWLASLPGTMSVGYLIDRRGPVPVVILGALCIGLGLIALGQVTQPWQLFGVYIVLGFGYPAMAAAAISPTLAPWFDKGFGAALGVALSGASVGGALVPVLLVYSSGRNGFEATMLLAGGTVLAVLVLVAMVLARLGRPERAASDKPAAAPVKIRERLRDPLFWRIAVAAALGLGGQVGLLAHQIPIVSVHGTPEVAAMAVTVVAVGSAVGRLVVAQASRVVPVTVLAALCYGMFGAGVAVIALSQSLVQVYIGCAIAGFVVGPIVLLPPVLVRQAFGSTGYGGTYALVNVVMYVLAALGPWIVGMLHAYWGDYVGGLWMLVLLEIGAIALASSPCRALPSVLKGTQHFLAQGVEFVFRRRVFLLPGSRHRILGQLLPIPILTVLVRVLITRRPPRFRVAGNPAEIPGLGRAVTARRRLLRLLSPRAGRRWCFAWRRSGGTALGFRRAGLENPIRAFRIGKLPGNELGGGRRRFLLLGLLAADLGRAHRGGLGLGGRLDRRAFFRWQGIEQCFGLLIVRRASGIRRLVQTARRPLAPLGLGTVGENP